MQWRCHCPDRGHSLAASDGRHFEWNVWRRATNDTPRAGAERSAPARRPAGVSAGAPDSVAGGTPLTRELRLVLAAFAGLALVAGFLLFPLAEETERFFSWTIQPPLTAAFMGAAYWAAFVLIGWAARAGTWEVARPVLVPVTTIAILLLVATLIHVDKFDLDSVFGWFWLVVYCTVPPVLAALVWAQSRRPGAAAPPGRSVPAALRAALLAQAAVMGALGAVMYVATSTAEDLWPWALTPLTARAVSAFLIGFACAAGYAAADNRLERFAGAAYAYTVLGALELLAAAIFAGNLEGGAGTVLYVAFAVTVLVVGAAGSLAVRRAQRR